MPRSMSARRIAGAGIVFGLRGVVLHAQLPSDIALKVKVTDATGASIPRALIQVRTSESRIESETRTDAQGEAVLYLDSGASTILSKRAGLRILEKRG